VLLKLHSYSLGFRIGYILASLHAKGISLSQIQALRKIIIALVIFGPKYLIISLEMPEGPVALLKGSCCVVSAHS
jgi:hypothetical protein